MQMTFNVPHRHTHTHKHTRPNAFLRFPMTMRDRQRVLHCFLCAQRDACRMYRCTWMLCCVPLMREIHIHFVEQGVVNERREKSVVGKKQLSKQTTTT